MRSGGHSPPDVVGALQGRPAVQCLRHHERVGIPEDTREPEAGSFLEFRQRDLEDPELVELQGFELVEVLGQQEGARLERPSSRKAITFQYSRGSCTPR